MTVRADVRHASGRGAGFAVLAVAAVLITASLLGDHTVNPYVFWAGLTAILLSAVVLLLPVPLHPKTRKGVVAFVPTVVLWGTGMAVAAMCGDSALLGMPLNQLAIGAGMFGLLIKNGAALSRARAGSEDPSLVFDALVLGATFACAGWDVLFRLGHVPTGTASIATMLVLVMTALTSCSAIALAIEHPRTRPASAGITLVCLASLLTAVCLRPEPHIAEVAAVLGLIGGLSALGSTPPVRLHKNKARAAARAARRLEIASLVPGPILLADLVYLVIDPRSDRILFAFYLSLLIVVTLRHATTARAVDRATARIRFQALHDPLTGLGNRPALAAALAEPEDVQSLVVVDLVGVDDITDVLGVASGEAVVAAAAAEVQLLLGATDGWAYRTQTHAFAVLLRGDEGDALRLAERLVAAIGAAPAQVAGAARFPLTAFAGVATVPQTPADDVMAPLLQAKVARRSARRSAMAVAVYAGQVAAEHMRHMAIREKLSQAIPSGAIEVHYQPIVNVVTGRVEKFEALARWEDPVLGRINPAEFIAIAEESNLIVALGEHVLRSAVAGAHAAGAFAAGIGLAVNVSVVQLQAPGFTDIVKRVLATHLVPPHLLTLELTESVFLDKDSLAERVVTELAGLGCRIAIDDFGTGYSAFGYLGRLPVHVLKVDRSLTQSLTDDTNGKAVVNCVVDLATRLGLTVIVEGVETEEQADICRAMSAPLGQGWLYSAAVPQARVREEMLRRYPTPARAQSRL